MKVGYLRITLLTASLTEALGRIKEIIYQATPFPPMECSPTTTIVIAIRQQAEWRSQGYEKTCNTVGEIATSRCPHAYPSLLAMTITGTV